ncbi:endo-1,4-beta-xylanase [Candidatus Acetothermia bacterium]|nr:endo-1,4-beta-xylanase [Candidatus Acetothermia bacterium]
MGNNRRITRRTFLSYGNTLILSTLALSKGISTSVFADEAPLRERAAAKGLIYGGEVNQDHIAKDAAFAARFLEECAILVPGNELKMGPLRPNQSTFNFAPGDFLFEFARTNKLLFRGHTLVWHNQLPSTSSI